MGDFGSATEAMRIIDLFALQVFEAHMARLRCARKRPQHGGSQPGPSLGSVRSPGEGAPDCSNSSKRAKVPFVLVSEFPVFATLGADPNVALKPLSSLLYVRIGTNAPISE